MPASTSMFLFPDDDPPAAALGGKGAALARLGMLGFAVPPWFAVPPECTWTAEDLAAALARLGGECFAVRSSGAREDSGGHSFAGQFETYLRVPPGEVAERIAAVRASGGCAAILRYCVERGLTPPGPPAVLVQRMIAPRCAGVAFSADPVSGRRGVAVVAATAGTAERLVAGESEGETWHLDRDGTLRGGGADAVAEGPTGGAGAGGVATEPAGGGVGPLLAAAEARAVAALARRCEAAFGRPQDIEWAIDGEGALWLLQSRAITTLGSQPDPDDTLRVWDNSNIAESYGGVTTPLTFSFARRVYESVYREFCRLMSVPEARLDRADDVFPQMLGLVRGRVYYNLVSWYRVLALLPGFRLNRGFMEQMMGVREPLPDEIVGRIVEENRGNRLADAMRLALTGGGLLRQFAGLTGQIARFRRRLDAALAVPPRPPGEMSGVELVEHYRDLERKLLRKWDAPLVNDFFAMIFHGVLRRLCAAWAGDAGGALANRLLADCGEVISAEPPRRIRRMAVLAAEVPGLAALLSQPELPVGKKLAALRRAPVLTAEFDAYLADFGDRCLEELKLESPTVRDDPASLLQAIGTLAGQVGQDAPPAAQHLQASALPRFVNPFKRLVFSFVLRQARARIRWRENLRFERTRVFGRVRTIVRELGGRLCADGVLDVAEDVFFLELPELLAAWEGTGTTSRLGSLAKLRAAEFAAWRQAPPLPDRFGTRGPVGRHASFESALKAAAADASLTGTGACPGRVAGKVRVVLDPRAARLEPGEILVARQTDPGWVVLFPAAAGLLVERGSLLSHSAIVARELRLPCIVGLPGVTAALRTGDLVEMDGATGRVRVVEEVAPGSA